MSAELGYRTDDQGNPLCEQDHGPYPMSLESSDAIRGGSEVVDVWRCGHCGRVMETVGRA